MKKTKYIIIKQNIIKWNIIKQYFIRPPVKRKNCVTNKFKVLLTMTRGSKIEKN